MTSPEKCEENMTSSYSHRVSKVSKQELTNNTKTVAMEKLITVMKNTNFWLADRYAYINIYNNSARHSCFLLTVGETDCNVS